MMLTFNPLDFYDFNCWVCLFLVVAQLFAHSNVDNRVDTWLKVTVYVLYRRVRNFLRTTAQEVAHFFAVSDPLPRLNCEVIRLTN